MSVSQGYPASTLAKVLDLSERRIRQLAQSKVIPKGEKGLYDLVGCVHGYIHYLRDKLAKAENSTENESLNVERKRLLKAQADMAECEFQEKRGELIAFSAVTYLLQEVGAIYTSSIDAIPGRFAQELVNISNPAVMKSKLFDECRRIRNSTSDQLQRWSEDFARRAKLEPTAESSKATHTE